MFYLEEISWKNTVENEQKQLLLSVLCFDTPRNTENKWDLATTKYSETLKTPTNSQHHAKLLCKREENNHPPTEKNNTVLLPRPSCHRTVLLPMWYYQTRGTLNLLLEGPESFFFALALSFWREGLCCFSFDTAPWWCLSCCYAKNGKLWGHHQTY